MFQFPTGLSCRWPHSRVEFIQDQYQVLLLGLKIQLQNSGSTDVSERRAQVMELMEMSRKYEGPSARAERLSGCSNEIMSRRKDVKYLYTLGCTRHSWGFVSWSMSGVERAAWKLYCVRTSEGLGAL